MHSSSDATDSFGACSAIRPVRSISPAVAPGHDGWRVVLLVASVVVAYHYSLAELWGSIRYDTPLAYLAFVPLTILMVSLARGRARPGELRLPDRQVDWLIGVPLLAVAAAVAIVGPQRVSYQFWTNRLDLLGLPFFVAGAVAILLGSRVLYRLRLPIAALALAWPYPYQAPLAQILAWTQRLALTAVRLMAPILGGVHERAGAVFTLGRGARAFSVNVAPLCAGASMALGFVLVGGSALMVMTGRLRDKFAWLVSGVAVMLTLNILRLALLFWTGSRYGAPVAMTWLHPYVGVVLFGLGTFGLLVLAPRLGVRIPGPSDGETVPAVEPSAGASWARLGPPGVTVVVLLGLLLSTGNADLRRFRPFAGVSTGYLRASLSAAPPVVPGWTGVRYDEITWARPYFGSGSRWVRYAYSTGPAVARDTPMFVDVVDTSDLESLSRYGVEACYRFHGFRIVQSRRRAVAGPAPGQVIVYRAPGNRDSWAALSWVTPVTVGGAKRFERIVVLSPVMDAARLPAVAAEELAFGRLLAGMQARVT